MKTTLISPIVAAIIFQFVFSVAVSAQIGTRSSLGLTGCAVTALEITTDSSVVLAGCEGPKGLYYSTDFGLTWDFAAGGDYTAGSATAIAATGNGIYAAVDNSLYRADAPNAGSWTPSWEEIDGTGDLPGASIYKSGSRYLLLTNVGPQIKVFDTQTNAVTNTIEFPNADSGRIIAVSGSYLFTVLGNPGEVSTFHRAGFNPETATTTSAWTDLTANLPANSNAWNMFNEPVNDKLYMGIRTLGGSNVDTLYVSVNDGDSFTSTGISAVPNSACFKGNTYIIGTRMSTNGGTSFTDLQDPVSDADLRFEDNSCLIDPNNENQAMAVTNQGIARTINLVSENPATWNAAVEGLESVMVRAFNQSPDNKGRVVLGTSAGVAFSDNFTDEDPNWIFPICPGNDCVGGRRVIVDPSDEDVIFYGSGNIRKGEVDTSGGTPSINWSDFSAIPGNFWFFSELAIYDFIPGSLYAAFWRTEGAVDGGIYVYQTSNGASQKLTTDSDIDGKPISAFIALSSDVMFAAVGAFSDNPSAELRGIFKSTDGGQNWDKVSDPALSSKVYIQDFEYDSVNDVLYAAAAQEGGQAGAGGNVYYLEEPKGSSGEWSTPSSGFPDENGQDVYAPNFSALTVDPTTGNVFASAGERIWRSSDQGETWQLYYTGLANESTNVLWFDTEEVDASKISASAVRSRLTQGGNSGLYQFDTSNDASDSVLTSPVWVTWNGYLQMINILELVNKGTSELVVTVSIYEAEAGLDPYEISLSVPAEGQRDLILNGYGVDPDKYGLVKLSFSGSNLDGRVSFYRFEQEGDEYQYAYSVPFANAVTGETAVSFNTYQPSLNAADASNIVAQWISIANLEDEAKVFTVNRYDSLGALIGTSTQTVPGRHRVDIEGGHENPGPGNVGLNVIVPGDASAKYLAQLVRYGERASSAAETPPNYAFAFPLRAESGRGQTLWVPISSGAGATNWLEMVNAGASEAVVAVEFYNNYGEKVLETYEAIPAYGQKHLEASAVLAAGVSGAAKIVPASTTSKIIAQSMFYFRNESDGRIEAMYGSQAKPASGNAQRVGSYNLYLNMFNWLRIFNTSDVSQDVTVETIAPGDTGKEMIISLAAHSGIDLGLHETGVYGTAVDTYGLCTVQGPVTAELLRIRPSSSGGIDFAAPTPVR